MKKFISVLLSFFAITLFAQTTPLWDLKSDKISENLSKGSPIVREDGSVLLDENSAFAVPASAFPDQKNFTVKIRLKYPLLGTSSACKSIFAKEGKIDSGFGLGIVRNKYYEAYISRVNLMFASPKIHVGRKGRTDPNEPMEFVLFAREGLVSFYCNDVAGPKIFATPIACDEPMWVGLNRKNFGDIDVLDLKVYGRDYKYKSPKEKSGISLYGVRVGNGWNLSVPKETDAKRPRVLIYGDSISMGYCPILRKSLEGKVYVEHWCHFANNVKVKSELYESVSSSSKIDVIVFNNGLHSTHWTKDKFSDEQIADSYRKIIEGFKRGAPKATLIYLNTTPISDGKTPRGLDEKNNVVIRLNDIAKKVMREYNIEVIDVYQMLLAHIEKMSSDKFHWDKFGYKMISNEVERWILKAL